MTRRAWGFVGVGCGGFAVQLGALEALTAGLGWAHVAATAVAVEMAILHNFAWHERWTWAERAARDPGGVVGRLVRFQVSNGLVSLAGNVVITVVVARATGAPLLVTNALAVGACAVLNFIAADRVVFRSGDEVEA